MTVTAAATGADGVMEGQAIVLPNDGVACRLGGYHLSFSAPTIKQKKR